MITQEDIKLLQQLVYYHMVDNKEWDKIVKQYEEVYKRLEEMKKTC